MKNFLISFLMGAIVGGGAVWYATDRNRVAGLDEIGQRAETAATQLVEQGAAAANRASAMLEAKLEVLDLQAGTIRDEMAHTGTVVRRKAREVGERVTDAAADARITTEIKADLVRDAELSAWAISVSTTDGRVTLAGDVSSPEQIGRAVLLAYQTPGVREVVSTLRAQEHDRL